MDYVLIIIFEAIGMAFKIGQQIALLKKEHPERSKKEIINTYSNEDWNVLFMSFVVLCFNLAAFYVIYSRLGIDWTRAWDVTVFGIAINLKLEALMVLFSVGIAVLFGYKGQDLLYKWFGSAADKLDKAVSEKLK